MSKPPSYRIVGRAIVPKIAVKTSLTTVRRSPNSKVDTADSELFLRSTVKPLTDSKLKAEKNTPDSDGVKNVTVVIPKSESSKEIVKTPLSLAATAPSTSGNNHLPRLQFANKLEKLLEIPQRWSMKDRTIRAGVLKNRSFRILNRVARSADEEKQGLAFDEHGYARRLSVTGNPAFKSLNNAASVRRMVVVDTDGQRRPRPIKKMRKLAMPTSADNRMTVETANDTQPGVNGNQKSKTPGFCEHCKKAFKPDGLRYHLKRRAVNGICPRLVSDEMKRRMRPENEGEVPTIRCEHCDVRFATRRGYLRHTAAKKKDGVCPKTGQSQNPDKYKCLSCGERSIDRIAYCNHVREVHERDDMIVKTIQLSSLNQFYEFMRARETHFNIRMVGTVKQKMADDCPRPRWFECNRSGHFVSKSRGLHRLKCPTFKLNGACTSFMKAVVEPRTGKVNVTYQDAHFGHDVEANLGHDALYGCFETPKELTADEGTPTEETESTDRLEPTCSTTLHQQTSTSASKSKARKPNIRSRNFALPPSTEVLDSALDKLKNAAQMFDQLRGTAKPTADLIDRVKRTTEFLRHSAQMIRDESKSDPPAEKNTKIENFGHKPSDTYNHFTGPSCS